jgi:hypothetical protein
MLSCSVTHQQHHRTPVLITPHQRATQSYCRSRQHAAPRIPAPCASPLDAATQPLKHPLGSLPVAAYPALDIANTAVVSLVAGGALAAGSASWCIGSLALTLSLLCAQLCVCVAVMPFITFFFHLHSVVTQVLTILSTGLALGAAVANSRTPQDLDSISTLSSASAAVSLLAVGVVATRMVIDLRALVVALLRIAQRLRHGAPRAALER